MIQAPSVPVLDLSTCDQEPIRTPGSIQPHGFLLTLSEGLEVLQASANLGDWCGCAAQDAIGRPLAAVIGEAAALRVAPELGAGLGPRPHYVGTVTAATGHHFDVLATSVMAWSSSNSKRWTAPPRPTSATCIR
jgi:light-regulated signal transduction histidine kinase (bacteriophytochrome)